MGLESDLPDPEAHVQAGAKSLKSEHSTRVETVPATTMTRALGMAGAPARIGLLSLDVEGAEIEVLKGIDFKRYQFDWMLIECRSIERLARFLDIKGYVLQEKLTHHDYLFSPKHR